MRTPFVLLLLALALPGCGGGASLVSYRAGAEERDALLCKPEGGGPFPAVVFNHGSIVDSLGPRGAAARGYNMEAICRALAREGFLAFLPIREKVPRGAGFMEYRDRYKEVVSQAVDHVRARPDVDPSRVALMGFSMGGLTSLMVAVERADLKAILLLAPAWGRGRFQEALARVGSINAPVLLLVERGDDRPILRGVGLLERALKEGGKEARIVRYDKGGGHRLFYDVGYYWEDVGNFLREKVTGKASP